jgi:hypothetical protein
MGFIDDISERFPAIGIAIEAVKTILDFSTWPFQALIAGVKGFFDQWDSSKGIVENIKNGFAGFFDGIFKFFETFAQRILDKIIEFAGKVKTGALQLIGIKGEDFIKNESSAAKALDSGAPLAKGSSFIPFDNFPAILHYGERVLTKRENEQYSGIFGNRVGSILGRAASAKSSTTSGSSGPTIKIGDRSDGGVTVSIGNITIGGNADSNIAMQIGQEVARQVARKLKEQKEATHDAKRRSF